MSQPVPDPAEGPTEIHRFADLAVRTFERIRDEVNALNVFPVADADTGSNLVLTARAAWDGVRHAGLEASAEAPAVAAAYGRAALLGAMGNSGSLFAAGVAAGVRAWAGGAGVAVTLSSARDAAYAAMADPVEGTLLTALTAASAHDTWPEAARAAHAAALATPAQLPALDGRPDAGAMALAALLAAVAGEELVYLAPVEAHAAERPSATGAEVMYLLDTDTVNIDGLRSALAGLGDSVVVVGEGESWNVHVHTDDPDSAVEAGEAVGRVHHIRVTTFDDHAHGDHR